MDLREAQTELGLGEWAIYDAVRRREIHCVKPAGRKLYLEDELRALAQRLFRSPDFNNAAA